jgi:glutathione S-transferase
MSSATPEIIFHAYPQSPVAEKVRVAFGIKGLNWRSVEIPRIPPKPMLIKLTGGYRRTPVMQISADIYCDSQCIIRELERRFPSPSFFPGKGEANNAGLMWALSRWTDGELFTLGVKIILGAAGENLPADFAEDRGRLYLGPDWAEGLKSANANLPHLVSQVQAPLSWLDQQLNDGRSFLLGGAPAAIDAQFYYVVWFLRGRWAQGSEFLSQFPALERWEQSVAGIGHGSSSDLTAEEALEIATLAQPTASCGIDPNDAMGFTEGMEITVTPDVDGGEQPVSGKAHSVTVDTISLKRKDPDIGDICVHFPRAGYRFSKA